jgi:hypothetical protein
MESSHMLKIDMLKKKIKVDMLTPLLDAGAMVFGFEGNQVKWFKLVFHLILS